jgi:pimeloyl-ACP methyl ester carboxylesterase
VWGRQELNTGTIVANDRGGFIRFCSVPWGGKNMPTTLTEPRSQTTATMRNPFALLRHEMDDLIARFWDSEPESVTAVVSRGGRPVLALGYLERVTAPTLLIVGGNDGPVVELNELAHRRLRCEKELIVIPGATHLFPEPGALEAVARHAVEWFQRHLASEEVKPLVQVHH